MEALTNDTYKTIVKPSEEVLFKAKNSKFYSHVFPVKTDGEVKNILNFLKKQHPKAGHFCYAYQRGTEKTKLTYRVNDDGEPSNSAGMPIYGQLQAFNVTNILIVVVRYFGGIKLGVGGLINAYKTSAQLALEVSNIKEFTIKTAFLLKFDYKVMNKVMRVIKMKQLDIINQKLELNCELTFLIRKSEANNIEDIFKSMYEVSIKKI